MTIIKFAILGIIEDVLLSSDHHKVEMVSVETFNLSLLPSTSHVPKSRICLTPEILSHDVNRWSSSGVTALKLAAPNAQIHKFSKANLVSGLASHYTLFWWGG